MCSVQSLKASVCGSFVICDEVVPPNTWYLLLILYVKSLQPHSSSLGYHPQFLPGGSVIVINNVYDAFIVTAIVRVYLVHLMNAETAPVSCQSFEHANQFGPLVQLNFYIHRCHFITTEPES